jgi:hypothetical protein
MPHCPFFHCAQRPSTHGPAKRKRVSAGRPAAAAATKSAPTANGLSMSATVASGCTMPIS